MSEPWIERFWLFVCRVFGHRFTPNSGWEYAGNRYAPCARCHHIILESTHDQA